MFAAYAEFITVANADTIRTDTAPSPSGKNTAEVILPYPAPSVPHDFPFRLQRTLVVVVFFRTAAISSLYSSDT